MRAEFTADWPTTSKRQSAATVRGLPDLVGGAAVAVATAHCASWPRSRPPCCLWCSLSPPAHLRYWAPCRVSKRYRITNDDRRFPAECSLNENRGARPGLAFHALGSAALITGCRRCAARSVGGTGNGRPHLLEQLKRRGPLLWRRWSISAADILFYGAIARSMHSDDVVPLGSADGCRFTRAVAREFITANLVAP